MPNILRLFNPTCLRGSLAKMCRRKHILPSVTKNTHLDVNQLIGAFMTHDANKLQNLYRPVAPITSQVLSPTDAVRQLSFPFKNSSPCLYTGYSISAQLSAVTRSKNHKKNTLFLFLLENSVLNHTLHILALFFLLMRTEAGRSV